MIKITRERRKSIRITVDEDLNILVRAPIGVVDHEIYKIIEQKNILLEEAKLQKQHKIQAKKWIQNKKILFLGKYRDIIIKNDSENTEAIYLYDDELHVVTSLGDSEDIKQLIEAWLKIYLRELLVKLTEKYCSLLKCEYTKITIRKQKTRWGSCSSKGSLSYNMKLIGAPLAVIEYVVLHEVMHLKYFDHSKQFWGAIEVLMPNYRECEKYLRENGSYLEI